MKNLQTPKHFKTGMLKVFIPVVLMICSNLRIFAASIRSSNTKRQRNISVHFKEILTGSLLKKRIAGVALFLGLFLYSANVSAQAEALHFDGINDRVIAADIDAIDGISELTFESMVQLESFPVGSDHKGVIGKVLGGDGSNISWMTITPNGQVSMWLGDNTSPANIASTPTGVLTLGTWHHLAAVFDGSQATNEDRLRIYVDGIEQPLTFTGTTPATTATTNYSVQIGGLAAGRFIEGSIDEVRIWSSARTCAEIDQFKDCELTGNESDLVAYYQFNQGIAGGSNPSETSLVDLTTNNNDGTLNNFALAGTSSNWIAPGGVTSGSACGVLIAPEITVDDASIATDFGTQIINTSSGPTTVSITNVGTADLDVTAVSSSDPQFAFSNFNAGILVPSASMTFDVIYTPTSEGVHNTSISISSNDCDENPYDFGMMGSGSPGNTAPIANCMDITVSADNNCEGTASAEDFDDDTDPSSDPDNDPITFSVLPAGPYALGDTPVTVTVSDGTLTTTCTATITVEDNEDPTFEDASVIELYNNDFETPFNTINASDCGGGIDLAPGINHWYGTAAYTFNQIFTVEAADISWPGYSDPAGTGGMYAIGMLSSAQNDKLSLTFDTQDKTFLNVKMDLSPIGLNGCYTPAPTIPNMRLSVYDSPGGSFNINSPGAPLDSKDLLGLAPDPSDPNHIYVWKEVVAGLDVTGSTDGNVSLVWDLLAGGYAAFDNLVIEASNLSIGDNCPENLSFSCLTDVPDAAVLEGFDNCDANPVVTFNEDIVSTNANDQVITRTWTVTDAAGNSTNCVQVITVEDTEAPTFGCQSDISINADAGLCTANVSWDIFADLMPADNCNISTATVDLGLGDGQVSVDDPLNLLYRSGDFPVGTTTVTYVIGDDAGLTATCSFDVIVTDDEDPNAICDDITVQLNANNMASIVAADIDGGSTDNCGIQSLAITDGQTSFTCDDLGQTFTLTLTVTDVNDRTATCTADVFIADDINSCNEAPVANCMDITISDNGNCEGNASAEDFDNDGTPSYDPDGDPLTFTVVPAGPYGLGDTPVTVMLSDGSLSSTCAATITVEQATPLTIACPTSSGECEVPAASCDAADIPNFAYAIWDNQIGNHTIEGSITSGGQTIDVTVTNASNSIIDYTTQYGDNPYCGTGFYCPPPAGGTQDFSFRSYTTGEHLFTFSQPVQNPRFFISSLNRVMNLSAPGILVESDGDFIGANDGDIVTSLDGNEACGTISFPGTFTQISFTGLSFENWCDFSVGIGQIVSPSAVCLPACSTESEIQDAYDDWVAGFTFSGGCNASSNIGSVPALPTYNCGAEVALDFTFIATDDLNPAGIVCNSSFSVETNIDLNITCPSNESMGPCANQSDVDDAFALWIDQFDYEGGCNATATDLSGTTAPSSDGGIVNITFTVTDDCGASESCSASFEVLEDTTDPTITCPGPVTQSADAGSCEATGLDIGTATFNDNCPGATVSNDAPASFPVGITTVTWTVTDAAGRTATCEQEVTVTDDEDPIFTCDGVAPLNYLETFPINSKGVAGGCSNSAPTSCASVNLSDVNWILGGNFNTALNDGGDFLLTQGNRFLFQDSNSPTYWQSPVIATAPSGVVDISVDVEYNIIGFARDEYVNVEYSIDGGSFVSFPNVVGTGGVFTIHPGPGEGDISGSITLSQTGIATGSTLIVRITSKNTNTSRRVFLDNVSVNGTGTNTIAVNNDPGLCGATIALVEPDVLDNCDQSLVVTNDAPAFFPVGTTDVIWTATDDNGNSTTCVQQVIVSDNEVPVAPTLTTITGDCEVVVIPPTTTDNCTATVTGTTTDPLVYSTPGNYTITWLFDDGNNNVNTITQQVVVNGLPIDLDCPSPENLSACSSEADIVSAYNLWAAGFEVNGGCNTQSNIADIPLLPVYNCGEGINLSFILLATDNNGSTSCASTFNVSAADPLMVSCPANESIGPCLIQTEVDAAFALWIADFDFSGGCNATATDLGGTTAPSSDGGIVSITYTVTDDCGASESCSASFEVLEDTTDPSITCPGPVMQSADAGTCEATGLDLGTATFNDNCPGAAVSNDAPSVYPLGTTTVTWTVTDAAGRTETCEQEVTITDDEDPTIVCPDPVTQSADEGLCEAAISIPIPAVSDNCLFIPAGTVSDPYTSLAQASASNLSGNYYFDVNGTQFSTELQNGWILLASSPSSATTDLSIVNDVSYQGNEILPPSVYADPTIEKVRFNATSGPFLPFDVESNHPATLANLAANNPLHWGLHGGVNEWTGLGAEKMNLSCSGRPLQTMDKFLYQACGNSSGMHWYPTDNGGGLPWVSVDFASGSNDLNLWAFAGTPSQAINDYNNTADASDIYPVGTTMVTWTVTDAAGNETSCEQIVTITDDEDPMVVCNDITIDLVDRNTYSLTSTDIDAIAAGTSDNCSGVTYEITNGTTDYDCDDGGAEFIVTLTATDAAGNTSDCTATVTIADPNSVCNDPPVAVCMDITISTDDNCEASINAEDVDGGSNDPDEDPLTFTVDNAGPFGVGTHTVILSVFDGEYTETCTATVTVEDNTLPIAVCKDITIQLDESGMATITSDDIDNGSSDACGITLSINETDFDCNSVGDHTITLTVTDDNNNVSTCTSNVTVEDNIPPVAVCQDITVQLDANGIASITADDIEGEGTCAGTVTLYSGLNYTGNSQVLTFGEYNFPALNGGVGNDQTKSIQVSPGLEVEVYVGYIDGNPSVILTEDTPNLGSLNTQVSSVIVACLGGADPQGYSDACGIADISLSQTDFDCTSVGENTVTVTVTDINGNVSTCSSNVAVEDNVPPVAECMDITIELDENGMASITAADIDNGSSDACGISLNIDLSDFDCDDVGANTVTLTVTDDNNNVSTCTATVTVEDNIDPTFSECPLDQNVNSVPGDCSALISWTIPTVSDNCGASSPVFTASGLNIQILGTSALGVFPVGTTTVTMSVTDDNNNEVSCTFDITVNDIEPPIITNCPSDFVVDAEPGECTADVFYGIITTSDNCAGVILNPLSGHMVDGDQFPVGVTQVTFEAVDAVGLITTCEFTVTVLDNEDPTIACPGDVNVTADTGSCEAIGIDLGTATYDDNCTGATVSNDAPASFPVGTTVVTWTVTDASGNTTTCEQNVTVTDDEDPMITCPVDVNVSADAGSCEATGVDLGTETISDNCPGATTINDAPGSFPLGTTVVTWTVTDVAGNTSTCTQNVTVTDDEDPMITCPVDVNLSADAGLCEAINVDLGTQTISDNCPGATAINDAPASFPLGTTVVTWTVTDAAGNTATCVQNVTVTDGEDPMIVCPSDITVSADQGLCEAQGVELNPPSYNDNCTGATISSDAPLNYPVGLTVVTWTVTDEAGNTATCTQNVTVTDDEAPTITCASDFSAPADAGSCVASGIELLSPTFNDNCPDASVSNDAPSSFPVGVTIVTWTVTDAAGNKATCEQTITVTDDEMPSVMCNDITIDLVDRNTYSLSEEDIAAIALGSSDNCMNLSYEITDGVTDYDCDDVGSQFIVTLTATDAAGNTSTCEATVNIEDSNSVCNDPPVAVCQDITIEVDGSCEASILPEDVDGGSSDPDLDPLLLSLDNSGPFGVGIHTVTLTVSDGEFTSTCTATVVVEDNTAPVAMCQDITVQLDAAGNGSILPTDIDGGSSDACAFGMSINQSDFDCSHVGDNTVTMTVTDASGNQSTCTANVFVKGMDADNDGVTICDGDCDDSDDTVYPGAEEICDGLDNDCDGSIDEPSDNSTKYEWIESIAIGDFENVSGNDNGYGNYCNMSFDLATGESSILTATPGYTSNAYYEFWRVYIDYNQNGTFEHPSELAGSDSGFGMQQMYVSVSSNSMLGQTKMRVIMSYSNAMEPCANGFEGEMEDYTVNITSCDNLTHGGEIAEDEVLCPDNYDPAEIISAADPSGGSGTIEYLWMKNTVSAAPPTTNMANWEEIPGATSSSYDPGPISETTWYIRCARRAGCTQWLGESNVIEKTFKASCAPYCDSYGIDSSYEWIQQVNTGNIYNNSGNDGGYGDYTNQSTSMHMGEAYTIKLQPGFSWKKYLEYWRVWIDFDQSGTFDAGELVAQGRSKYQITRTMHIPYGCTLGNTRMRVSMKYGSYPGPCEVFSFGELEDYSIEILPAKSLDKPSDDLAANMNAQTNGEAEMDQLDLNDRTSQMELSVYPNPTADMINVSLKQVNEDYTLSLLDAVGKEVWTQRFKAGTSELKINVNQLGLNSGNYTLMLRSESNHGVQKIHVVK